MKQLRLSLIALITGSLSGAAVAMVIGLIGWISQQLWGDPVLEGLDQTLPLAWTLPVCGGFGLVLALLHRRGPSTLLPELGETLHDLRHPETAPKRDNVRAIIGAALALIGGGSIGPEALMSRLAALISQRIWRGRDHALREATLAGSLGLFGAPLLGGAVVSAESSTSPRNDVVKRWVPGILGGIAGFAAFHGIGAATGGSLQRLPYVWPSTLGEDIGTLSAGLIGGGIGLGLGWLLQHWRHWLDKQQLLARWAWWPLLTGLLIGACMHWLPLVPFAGEDQMRPLLEQSDNHPAWLLLLSSLVKLLMLGLCLATGWRGGIFFPVFLIACATGTALHQLIPDLGSLGSWCGAITGAMYRYLLPGPLVVLVLGLALLQGHGATGLLVGLAIAHWFRLGPGADGGPPPPPETPDSRGYPQPRS